MPIATRKIDANVDLEVNTPLVQPENYQGLITTNDRYPITSLLTYTTGAPWTVDYYSQILGKHNDLKDFDPNIDRPYQQYRLIKDLELRVSSPLEHSYTSATSMVKITGAATVPFTIIPNVGDVFTARIDNGELAIFRVTNIERKSFNRPSIFHIEYDIVNLVSNHPEWFDIIQSKVQHTYYFHKDRLVDGLDALVTIDQHEAIRKCKLFLNKIIPTYFSIFYNKGFGTLVLPKQEITYYDPLLVRFLLKICSSLEAPELLYIKNLSIQNDPFLAQSSIWDALLEQEWNVLMTSNKRMGFISSGNFMRHPRLDMARYQQISYMLYPLEPDMSTRIGIQLLPYEALEIDLVETTSHHGITDYTYNEYVTDMGIIPILPIPFVDNYYVLSKSFYDKEENLSLIETMATEYMDGHSLDVNKLLVLTNNWHKWSRMEQFYYTPLVIYLLRVGLGSVSI